MAWLTLKLSKDNQPHHQRNPTVTQPKHEKTIKPETIRFQYQRLSSNSLFVNPVAIGNPEQHVRKALHRGSKQQ